MNDLDQDVTKLFELGPAFLQPKRHAARRRRWFAFLQNAGVAVTLPPKYITTRFPHCIFFVF